MPTIGGTDYLRLHQVCRKKVPSPPLINIVLSLGKLSKSKTARCVRPSADVGSLRAHCSLLSFAQSKDGLVNSLLRRLPCRLRCFLKLLKRLFSFRPLELTALRNHSEDCDLAWCHVGDFC